MKVALRNLNYIPLVIGVNWGTIFDYKPEKQGGTPEDCTNQNTMDLLNVMDTYDLNKSLSTSQANWCNMTFTAGNLVLSHSCIGVT